MDLYSVRILRSQPLRLGLTVGGVALCIVLMLFLLAVYHGVADGSVEYIRQNRADLWVLQRNAWNILRGSSLLSTGHGVLIREISGIESAAPVLLLLSAIKKGDQVSTVFLAGFDPMATLGGPPRLVEGRSLLSDGEIVLDRSFARKYHYRVGEFVQIQDDTLKVVGLSTGTNALVIQYAFVTLRRAQAFAGVPSIVTCYLVRAHEGHDVSQVAEAIREELPGLEVYDHETFLQNNIREMESGFLPFLYSIAAIGVIVLTAILSLLLSINILERRKEFAVMKTLGSPRGFLPRLVVGQALLISAAGNAVAVGLFFPMADLINSIWPEVCTKSSVEQVAAVVLLVLVVSLVSSSISVQRLRHIYPMEAFS